MVNKLVHLDADSETTKESSVVPNDFSLYVGKPLTDAEKLSALEDHFKPGKEDFLVKLLQKSVSEYAIFKIFLGGMPPDPLAIAYFTCWLLFAQHGSQALFLLDSKLVTKISRATYVCTGVWGRVNVPQTVSGVRRM